MPFAPALKGPPRETTRGGPPARKRPWGVVLVASAVAGTIVGLVLVVSMAGQRPTVTGRVGEVVSSGGVDLKVEGTDWLSHHDPGSVPPSTSTGRFEMPASMMPGMPEAGTHRLHIEVTLHNPTSGTLDYEASELRLTSAAGSSWTANPGSLASGTLVGGASITLDPSFDIPETESNVSLMWTRAGIAVRIPLGAEEPPHQHS
jgi:hypothetical protein